MQVHISKTRMMDAAMQLAEQSSWQNLHMHDIANTLNTDLLSVHHYFADKDALVSAWFDQADEAMIAVTKQPGFYELSARARFYQLVMAWIHTLQQHKEVTKQMITEKMNPTHLSHLMIDLMHLRKTVDWLHDAANHDHGLFPSVAEQMGLSTLLFATLIYWLSDDSSDSHQTHQFLAQQLHRLEKIYRWLPGHAH